MGVGYLGDTGLTETQIVSFTGKAFIDCQQTSEYHPIEATVIGFFGSSIILSSHPPTFKAPYVRAGHHEITLVYESTGVQNSEKHVGFSVIYLQVGEVTLPIEANWTICVSKLGLKRCFPLDSSRIQSFTISLPSLGRYFFDSSGDSLSGSLVLVNGESSFDINSAHSYIAKIQFSRLGTKTPSLSPTRSQSFLQSPSPDSPHSLATRQATVATPTIKSSTKSQFPTASIFIAAECKSVNVPSEPYHQLKIT
jgi:hypothetical protein